MAAATGTGGPPPFPTSGNDPLTERIKQNLLKEGVNPTPKMIHMLRKKHIQKSQRKFKRVAAAQPHMTESQKQSSAEEFYLQNISREYKNFMKKSELKFKTQMVGRPWERLGKEELKQLGSSSKEHIGEKLKSEHLKELGDVFEVRKHEAVASLLDNDIELEDGAMEEENGAVFAPRRRRTEAERVRIVVNRLSARETTMKDWKFSRIMKQSELQFTEAHMLKIVGGLGARRCWKQAMDVVQWVYSRNEHKHYKSRFVYTKLLAVLGKTGRSKEALQIFKIMRGDCQLYPDMAAYHSIAVTLGQAGLLRDLMKVIECMKEKPSRRIKNMRCRNWDPTLLPDLVIFNSVVNACIPSHQWKGVSWVFQQLRKAGLRPNGATYGLAMEVMLHSGKFDLVHELFEKMKRSGESPNAITYRILVRTFWEEGAIDNAVDAVREMERKGVVGTASVYYELACCLCNNGRWQEAITEIKKLQSLPRSKPLEIAFTGMIMSCMDAGHTDDCGSIFEHMHKLCSPNIGTINAMIEVYGRSDMFSEAKALFEDTKRIEPAVGHHPTKGGSYLTRDEYTYNNMLKASARAQQWEYFENVYKEMALSGTQLDQIKYYPLFVAASRAGKFHLLEHLVDTILDAGDIPHPSLFAEMVCQATSQHDYERAVKIVNTMAYAPSEVNVDQWMDVLKIDEDRITIAQLRSLLDTLCYSQVSKEATVCNLISSLKSLCGTESFHDPHDSTKFVNVAAKNSNDNSEVVRGGVIVGKPKVCSGNEDRYLLSEARNGNIAIDLVSADELEEEEYFDWTVYVHNHDKGNSSSSINLAGVADEACAGSADSSMHLFHDDWQGSELPSAEEILKAWEKSRRDDGLI